jgi:hypothetical protein
MTLAQESLQDRASGAAPPYSPVRMIRLFSLTLALGYLIVLGGSYLKGDFLADSSGRPIANDFVNVYAAGQLTLAGDPTAAYDWPTHKQAEVRAIGHDFDGYYGWHYPPPLLFAAAALATLPFFVAALVSLVASLAAYVAALAAATLLATPYLYMYDLAVLAVAVAFLLRYALERRFLPSEIIGFAGGSALILSFPYAKTQVGLAAV